MAFIIICEPSFYSFAQSLLSISIAQILFLGLSSFRNLYLVEIRRFTSDISFCTLLWGEFSLPTIGVRFFDGIAYIFLFWKSLCRG